MTTNYNSGVRYTFTRTMMQKFLETGTLNIACLYPIEWVKVGNKRKPRLGYEISVATDNSEGVETFIRNVVVGDAPEGSWDVVINSTRLRREDVRDKHPITVTLRCDTLLPFCFSELKANVPGNHYLSNTYNNGILPTAIFQFAIPEKYQAQRMKDIQDIQEKYRHNIGGDLKPYSEYDAALLNKIWIEDDIQELDIYVGYGVKIDLRDPTRSCTISPKFGLFRSKPIFPKLKAEVLDCLPIHESIKYQAACGFKNTTLGEDVPQRSKDQSMLAWIDFLKHRTFTRINAPINHTTIDPDFLVYIVKLTPDGDIPKGVRIHSVPAFNNKTDSQE